MNDNTLIQAWTAVEPTPAQRRRIDAQVTAWMAARYTSLFAEWLEAFRLKPLAALVIGTVAGCLVLLTSPLGWLTFAVL